MAFISACKDFGVDCPFVARGEKLEGVMTDDAKHAKQAHGYTDNQVNDPRVIVETKKLIRKI